MAFKPSYNEEKKTFKILGRLSYFHGYKKTASTEGGKLMYRTNVLLDPSTKEGKASIAIINEAIEHCKAETWPGKNPKFPDPKRYALNDGDEYTTSAGDVRDGYEGMKFMQLRNDRKPKLRHRDGQTEAQEEEELLYSGGYAVIHGHLYGVKDQKKGGNGIFATLDVVQFFKHGEKFGGGGIDDEDIEDYGDDDDDDEAEAKTASKSKPKGRSIDDDDI